MANEYKAEVDIIIKGKNYVMRPTFNALCEIEKSLGKSIITLLIKFDERGIMLKELLFIIRAGLKAAQQKIPKDLEQSLYTQGYATILPIICQFLKNGLNL
jgi:hypothetical protein